MASVALTPPPARRRRRRTVAGGVGPIGLGVATLWLSVIVLLPLAAVSRRRSRTARRALGRGDRRPGARGVPADGPISLIVALVNVVIGTLIAWVLVRDDFRGKGIVNAIIDLPFALPTIVATIVLLTSTARAARSACTSTRPGRRSCSRCCS